MEDSSKRIDTTVAANGTATLLRPLPSRPDGGGSRHTCAQLGPACRKFGDSKYVKGAYLPARSNTNGVSHRDTSTLQLLRPKESAYGSREPAGPPMAKPTASQQSVESPSCDRPKEATRGPLVASRCQPSMMVVH